MPRQDPGYPTGVSNADFDQPEASYATLEDIGDYLVQMPESEYREYIVQILHELPIDVLYDLIDSAVIHVKPLYSTSTAIGAALERTFREIVSKAMDEKKAQELMDSL